MLPLVVAEAQSEVSGQAVPVALGANCGANGATADAAAANVAGAGWVGGDFGDVDGVVDLHDAVDGLGM